MKSIVKVMFPVFMYLVASVEAAPVNGIPTTYNIPLTVSVTGGGIMNGTTISNGTKDATVAITYYNQTSSDANGSGSNLGNTTSYKFQDYKTSVASNGSSYMSQADANKFVSDVRSGLSSAANTYAAYLTSSTVYLANEIATFNAKSATYTSLANAIANDGTGYGSASSVNSNITNWSGQVTSSVNFFNTVATIGFGSDTATGQRKWFAGQTQTLVDGNVDYSTNLKSVYLRTDTKLINVLNGTVISTLTGNTLSIGWNDTSD